MKKVFIKYNPYRLETEITVDGKGLKENSGIREMVWPGGEEEEGARLQSWVENLPEKLVEEYNDKEFDITFHGTKMDYEDLSEAFEEAYNGGKMAQGRLSHIPAKETSNKETRIDEIFREIQQGPFEELKSGDVKAAFEDAKKEEFEVVVVAPMSAGKSTLINALLQTKLMPSKAESCTAIITRIKHHQGQQWRAEAFDKNGDRRYTIENLTYGDMERLNADENAGVSKVEIEGEIPFVISDETEDGKRTSLVLIDTPGPNNKRDEKHKEIQREFLKDSSKALVLFIMESTFNSTGAVDTLTDIADTMRKAGKQSRDRFLFVVNKLDARNSDDVDISGTLQRVRDELKKIKITAPNLFPAAALPALNIRLVRNGVGIDDKYMKQMMREKKFQVETMNDVEELHLEIYATLQPSIQNEIKEKLKNAEASGDADAQAEIHTGIISIEAVIRQYVEKYARTAKIKNIVDTFESKLDAKGVDEENKLKAAGAAAKIGLLEGAEDKIKEAEAERDKIVSQLDAIRAKIDSMKSAKEFKNQVDHTLSKVKKDSQKAVDGIVKKFQMRVTGEIDDYRKTELNLDRAQEELKILEDFARKLQSGFIEELDGIVNKSFLETCKQLLDEYKGKLRSLTEEIKLSDKAEDFQIDPLKLLDGEILSSNDVKIQKFVRNKKVEDGKEWVKNTDKKWYKPWTWFQESGYYRKKYKDVEYVKGDEIAQSFLAPIQQRIFDDGEAAWKYTVGQSERTADMFKVEFERLDGVLMKKLDEYMEYATNKDKAEERIRECKANKQWLDKIRAELQEVLEI